MPSNKTICSNFTKMEASFIASSTLKRNKRYLDIERINGEEEFSHLMRRRPTSSAQSVDAKVNRSFSNSTAALTERRNQDISRFRSKIKTQQRPASAQSFYSRSGETSSSKTARGVGIGQHLSRQDYYKIRSKPTLDERLFNNFTMEAPDQTHTINLGRGPKRNFDNSYKHMSDIQYNTQQLYQDCYYRRSTMDCRFHYKKQKEEERSFFVTPREQNKPATELSPRAVRKAEDSVRVNKPVDSFYMNSGRELPCQIDQRSGTALTSHWRNGSDVIERSNPEYSVRSMKQGLCEERKQRISESKRAHFSRGEVCDKKFFIIKGAV